MHRHPASPALAAIVLLAGSAWGQPSMKWVRQVGSSQWDVAYAATSDSKGGVILGGITDGVLIGFPPGDQDAFLARYDADGNALWIKQFGTGQPDFANALVPDGKGGAYLAGSTAGSFGAPNFGWYDPFIARYDGAGNKAWAAQIGSTDLDRALAVAADDLSIYIAGYTDGNLGGPKAGGDDAFAARFDTAGTLQWIVQFGTTADDQAVGLVPDGEGGIIVAGFTGGSIGAPSFGKFDAFLVRLDSAGQEVWKTQLGSAEIDLATALCPDGAGGVFITGWTFGDLGGPHIGDRDAFLARVDSAGGLQWVKIFGTGGEDDPWAILPDGSGGAMVGGESWGSLGGLNAGYSDAFVADFNSAGDQQWATQFGTGSYDGVFALSPAPDDDFYATGQTFGNLGGPQQGNGDIFLARFAPPCYADCDASGSLDLFDFLCFVNQFGLGGWVYADCDQNGNLDLFDFFCFVNAFNAGC